MMLRNEEIAKLKHKSEYDDAINDWVIPPFKMKEKEVHLPTMKKAGKAVMEADKESRELEIQGSSSEDSNRDIPAAKKQSNRGMSQNVNP